MEDYKIYITSVVAKRNGENVQFDHPKICLEEKEKVKIWNSLEYKGD